MRLGIIGAQSGDSFVDPPPDRTSTQGGQDTLYRIHGTNQPGWIGHAISSGCIRLTNEDIIDLYSHVKMGAL